MNGTSYFLRLIADKSTDEDANEWLPALDRRTALRMIGFTAATTLAGCGGKSSATSQTSNETSTTTATSTTLTASPTSAAVDASVTLSANVSPSAAAGSVSFLNGTASLGSATLSDGTASLVVSFASAGTESLKAVYAGNTTYASSTSSTVSVTVTGTASGCTETLEGEEGPYFVDDSASGYNRSNILTNLDGTEAQSGVPFTLTLYVLDAKNSCAGMKDVQVDIWHCNAKGIYSAESSESTTDESWLRGYQLTDANGMVQFTTIIPGWYAGRTTHIHLRLRSTYDSTETGGTNTMQLFFDQTLIDTLASSVSPYSTEGANPTTNASDHVYSNEESGTTLMTLAGSTTAGYTATAMAYLPIVTTY
jgi:protocatechuate 3,4-dioxygenase beta subunit